MLLRADAQLTGALGYFIEKDSNLIYPLGGCFPTLDINAQNLSERISRIMPLMTAADFCDRNAQKFGPREALVDRRRRLTWSEVKRLSDRLAARQIKCHE